MARSILTQAAILLAVASLLLTTTVHAQVCDTAQNPYCAGNAQFEQLCCNPGSICYWSNRNGAAACCQAGTDCTHDNGPNCNTLNVVTQVQKTTYYSQVPTPAVVYYTSTPDYNSWQPWTSVNAVTQPAVVYVTSTVGVETQPYQTDQTYVTVTQPAQPVQVLAEAARYSGSQQAMYRAVMVAAVAAGACALVA